MTLGAELNQKAKAILIRELGFVAPTQESSSHSKIQNHQPEIINPSLFPWASPSHHPPIRVSAGRANAC